MRFEDRQSLFEAAFAKIEPKDEAEREKLARFRERLREMDAEFDREIAKFQKEAAATRAEFESTKPVVQERSRTLHKTRDALLAACDEQADLIERIAYKTVRHE